MDVTKPGIKRGVTLDLFAEVARLRREVDAVKAQRDGLYDAFGMVLHRMADSPGLSAADVLAHHYLPAYHRWLEAINRPDADPTRSYAQHLRAALDARTEEDAAQYARACEEE